MDFRTHDTYPCHPPGVGPMQPGHPWISRLLSNPFLRINLNDLLQSQAQVLHEMLLRYPHTFKLRLRGSK